MELCADDRVTANPSAADVAHAIDDGPQDKDWFINLDADEAGYIEAFAAPDGRYLLTYMEGSSRFDGSAAVDKAKLKTIFVKYLNGDTGWRGDIGWSMAVKERNPDRGRSPGEPPRWIVVAVAVTFFLPIAISLLPQSWVDLLPFSGSAAFYPLLIAAPMAVLVLAVLANKLAEVKSAAVWRQASGRITRSASEADHHKFSGEATKVQNLASVTYEFSVDGRNYTGSRISIGEAASVNIEDTLRRYPVGAIVTVYYDPANPRNCALERNLPKDFRKGLAAIIAVAVAAAFGAGLYWLLVNGPGFLQGYVDEDQAPVVIFASLFGAAFLALAFAARRNSARAQSWPVVPGLVVTSGTESYKTRQDHVTRVFYVPVVEYAYKVNGIDYRSRQIKLGVEMNGTLAFAEQTAGRYSKGSKVEVHYDPANPRSAALENPSGPFWLLLALALGSFAAAAYALGFFQR